MDAMTMKTIRNLAIADGYDAIAEISAERNIRLSDRMTADILDVFANVVLGECTIDAFKDLSGCNSRSHAVIDELARALEEFLRNGSDLEDDDDLIDSMMKGVPTPYKYRE